MAMDASKLADELKEAGGQKGSTPDEQKGFAKAIIEEIQQLGLVNFLPGTVKGNAPPSGGPLAGGNASGGVIVGPQGPTLAARMAAGMGKGPPTPQVVGFATAITTHLLTAQVEFSSGVTGSCTNTGAPSPGPLLGEASKGKIKGMQGKAMADLAGPALGGPATPSLIKQCQAIVDHIQKNAEVSFLTGTIIGTCPSGGGPILLGAGTGGKIQ